METVCTRQLIDRGFTLNRYRVIMDPQDIDHAVEKLKGIRRKTDVIEIYDCSTQKKLTNTIFPVNDHINRTGVNPLVGRQTKLNVEFIDLSTLYVKKPNGITTFCCGNHPVPEGLPFPSMFLSTLSILARALDYKEIHAYIVC